YLTANFSRVMRYIAAINIQTAIIVLGIYFAKNVKEIKKIDIKNVLQFLFLLILAVIVYAVWRWDSGFYTTLNWDFYHHQVVSRLITEGKFDFITSNVSDSFQFIGYSTIFHTMFAFPQVLLTPDLLKYWWFLEFIHLFTTILASYVIAKVITKNEWIGVLSAIIGAFVFESTVAYTSLFLMPQNIAAVLVTIFIAQELREVLEEKSTFKRVITFDFLVFLIYILMNHAILGVLGVVLVFFSKIFKEFHKLKMGENIINTLLVTSFLLLIIIPYFASLVDLNFINRGEAEFFNFTLSEKYGFMRTIYGFSLLAFLPLGYYFSLAKKSLNYKLLIILINGILALVIASIPYSLKFYTILRFFVHTGMALGIWLIIRDFGRVTKLVSTFLIFITMLVVLTINIDTYKQVPSYKEISTHVTANELEAAKFLEQVYTNRKVILISDPGTMHILEGLSGVNTPGGAYTSLETRKVLTDIYYSRNKEITQKLFTINDGVITDPPQSILFAVGGRFSKWQLAPDERRLGIFWNVWKPHDLSIRDKEAYDFIFYLDEILEYQEVFKNDGVVIFEIPIRTIFPENT
ncbi:MAG: hypothetical protein R3250_14320, partial [Melioribacteraceae bacterium]|nr:hypothetical protein [Melioribacteraceae bacterium]